MMRHRKRGGMWCWGLLGVDGQRLPGLSGVQAAGGRAGRVQRQVHERTDGAARRILRDAGGAYSIQPTGIFLRRRHAGNSPEFDWLFSSLFCTRQHPRNRMTSFAFPTTAITIEGLIANNSSPAEFPLMNGSHRRCAQGLSSRPKRLPPWLFYDAAGSRLFEEITERPEYYPDTHGTGHSGGSLRSK